MKKLFVIIALSIATSAPGFGQGLSSFNGDCDLGNQATVTQGLKSVGTVPLSGGTTSTGSGVMGSFPKCLVTVYFTGTTNKASLFSNNLSTPTPIANPFTANADGTFLFFTSPACYDIVTQTGSGPTMPATRTYTSECLGSSNNPSVSPVTFSATPTFVAAPFSIFSMTLTGNVTGSSITNSINGEIVGFNVCQDGTGGRTFSWPASFLRPPTIASGAGACTNATFFYDGTNWRQLAAAGDTLVPAGGISGTWPGNPIWSGIHTFPNTVNACRVNGWRLVDAANTCAWTGTDPGGWVNQAYSESPTGQVFIAANTSCYQFATPIVLNTNGKIPYLKGAGATSTCLQYTASTGAALTLDAYNGNGIGGFAEGFEIKTTVSGATSTGISLGPTNNCSNCHLKDIYYDGFQIGIVDQTFGVELYGVNGGACSSASGSIALETVGTFADETRVYGGFLQGCNTLIDNAGLNPLWIDGTTISNATGAGAVWLANSGVTHCTNCHLVNSPTGATTNWFNNSSGVFYFTDTKFETDKTSGSLTSFATVSGGNVVSHGSQFLTAGESVTEAILFSSSGQGFFSGTTVSNTGLIPAVWNPGWQFVTDASEWTSTGHGSVLAFDSLWSNTPGSAPIGNTANPFGSWTIGNAANKTVSGICPDCSANRTIREPDASTNGSAAVMNTTVYTNGTTTPSSIPGLSFPVAANVNYTLSCNLYYLASSSTAGLDVTITGPSPLTVVYSYMENSTATSTQSGVATAFGTKLTGNAAVTASVTLPATVTMGLRNGSSAGTVTVQGSATGSGTVTVQPGSFCVLQ